MGGVGSSHHRPFISVTHDRCFDMAFVMSIVWQCCWNPMRMCLFIINGICL